MVDITMPGQITLHNCMVSLEGGLHDDLPKLLSLSQWQKTIAKQKRIFVHLTSLSPVKSFKTG